MSLFPGQVSEIKHQGLRGLHLALLAADQSLQNVTRAIAIADVTFASGEFHFHNLKEMFDDIYALVKYKSIINMADICFSDKCLLKLHH